jgi:hypothetical protein
MRRYDGSDGTQYTEDDVWDRLECGSWRVFCWDAETRFQAFETESEELLFLRPVGTEYSPSVGEVR